MDGDAGYLPILEVLLDESTVWAYLRSRPDLIIHGKETLEIF